MSDDLNLLNHKFDSLNETVNDVKLSIKELTTAITKLTLIEERQLQTSLSVERAFNSISRIEERLNKLELMAPANKKLSVWIDRASWAAMGLIIMFVIKKSGML